MGPFYVFVEGGIGVGKTCVVNMLRLNHPTWTFFPEPIDVWQNWNGVDWLERYYKNPGECGAAFQDIVLESYKPLLNFREGIILCERSPRASVNPFSKLMVESGYLTADEYTHLMNKYDRLYKKIEETQPLTIYLRTSPKTAYARMRARNRPAEDPVNLEYVQKLHDEHDKEFAREKTRFDWVIDEEEEEMWVMEKVQLAESYIEDWLADLTGSTPQNSPDGMN